MTVIEARDPERDLYLENDPELAQDERWLLVQRIASSKRFERAGQLRGMLKYVAWHTIKFPGETLREEDIAHKVMERSSRFDPAYDSAVRVQASHLRKRLEQYFAEEGVSEPLIIRIPKGSYLPQFLPNLVPQASTTADSSVQTVTTDEPLASSIRKSDWSWKVAFYTLAALLAIIAVIFAAINLRPRVASLTAIKSPVDEIGEKFLQRGKPVTVVLPDTSLMEIQTFLNIDVSMSQYLSSDFPQNVLGNVTDPQLHDALVYVGVRHATSAGESSAAMDVSNRLGELKLNPGVRYARDLRIPDLRQGNFILIGNFRSNPWVSLFSDRMAFRYFETKNGHYFINTQPKPGEQARYQVNQDSDELINYVDIALLPNLTDTGYVLLINGSDMQSNEAALGFLLHGKLPPEASKDLSRPNLKSMEILLKGRSLGREVDHRFEVISYKSE